MDVQHLDYDDESLVRAALQAAYPSDRPIFSQRRGAQIVQAAAARELEGSERRRPFVGGRAAALAAAAFTLLAGTAGVASAALPGEHLYPIKQVVERAMVAIAGDDVEAARLELRFAERRLREASALRSDADHTVDTALEQRFREHLDAAATLGGERVSGEVEQLEQSGDAQRTGHADAASPEQDTAPVELIPQQEPGADDGDAPEPAVTPSPSPSPVPSVGPAPVADPTRPPGTDPSPLPTPVGVATPGDGEHEGDTSPPPSPEAPGDDAGEPPTKADAASP